MKTEFERKETVRRNWYVVDACDQVVGRLAAEIAHRLRGKHKPMYTPNMDNGDYIIVVNVDKIRITGRKPEQKMYYHHSGYPGGLKSISAKKLLLHKPERILEHAVKGMLPKTKLGRRMYKKMKIYAGPEHPHEAQQPKVLMLAQRN